MSIPVFNRNLLRATQSDSSLSSEGIRPPIRKIEEACPNAVPNNHLNKEELLDLLKQKRRNSIERLQADRRESFEERVSSGSNTPTSVGSRATTPRQNIPPFGRRDSNPLLHFPLPKGPVAISYIELTSIDDLCDKLTHDECYSLIQLIKNFWAVAVGIPGTNHLPPNHDLFRPTQRYLIGGKTICEMLLHMKISDLENFGSTLAKCWMSQAGKEAEPGESFDMSKFFTKFLDEK